MAPFDLRPGKMRTAVILKTSLATTGSATTRNHESRKACLAMVHKLCQSAEGGFQRLNGSELIKNLLLE